MCGSFLEESELWEFFSDNSQVYDFKIVLESFIYFLKEFISKLNWIILNEKYQLKIIV